MMGFDSRVTCQQRPDVPLYLMGKGLCSIVPGFLTDVHARAAGFARGEESFATPGHPAAAQTRRAPLIVAGDVDGETLAACILNKLRVCG